MKQANPILTKQRIDEIDMIVEDAVASSAIEGYITPEEQKEQLRQWYLKGLSADEMMAEIKKDMGLK